MTGPAPAVAAVRAAVRRALADVPPDVLVLVACSGGADSLALAAALAFEAPRAGRRGGAVVVDHGLQPDSARVAAQAARQCRELGLDPVDLATVTVPRTGDGPEAEARDARYRALVLARERLGATVVLLAHTRDDQAEQVLLGLARGSGARSLSGMPAARHPYLRPLLRLDRATTAAACAAEGLTPWHDPHNEDPAYHRVRARWMLSLMEEQLGPGVARGLSRTADLLREDADLLDGLATRARADLGEGPWEVRVLAALPRAIRTRVWRLVAIEAGSPPGALSATHVEAVDALVTRWHGQGPSDLPGLIRASRSGGRVTLEQARPVQ